VKQLFLGSTTGAGGFFFFCRFGFTTWTMGDRLFVGMCVDTTALLTADPSAKFNTLGFGVDAADIAISFMHNDSVGIATKDAMLVNQLYLVITHMMLIFL
jgi:hypothetical protein